MSISLLALQWRASCHTHIMCSWPFLILQVIFDILKVDLLVSYIICNAKILHILPAEHSEVIQVLRHIHDGLSYLPEAKSDLKEVITSFVTTRQLTLAQEHALVSVQCHLFLRIYRDKSGDLLLKERNIRSWFTLDLLLSFWIISSRKCRFLSRIESLMLLTRDASLSVLIVIWIEDHLTLIELRWISSLMTLTPELLLLSKTCHLL